MRSFDEVKNFSNFVRLLAKHGRFSQGKPAELLEKQELEKDAQEFVDTIEMLGPTFIKLGQVLATRKTLFPESFLTELQRLQDKVKSIDAQIIKEIIERELGSPLKKMFSEFSLEPLSTASLGQVHRAVLRSGKSVVVKVQKPNIRTVIEKDIAFLEQSVEALNALSDKFKRYHIKGILSEFKSNIRRELNYEEEAQNLTILQENLKGLDSIVIPEVFRSYSTDKVITMTFIEGQKISGISPLGKTEVSGELLIDELFKAYLKQVLVDGFIHSDPHLGNILLLDSNKLAIIDLGMVTKIGPSIRHELQQLLLFIGEGRATEAAELALKLAIPSKDFDDDVIGFKEDIYQIVKDEQGKPLKEIKVGEGLMRITDVAAGNGLRFPAEFSSIARTLMYLDEVALHLMPDFNPQASLRKNIAKFMSASYVDEMSFKSLMNESIQFKNIIQSLPNKVDTLLDDTLNRRLKFQVDVFDEDKLIQGFEKVANRIAAGLILASLIVGSSLMMRYETNFTIFGYPGFAMILLLCACFGSFSLVINVLLKDR